MIDKEPNLRKGPATEASRPLKPSDVVYTSAPAAAAAKTCDPRSLAGLMSRPAQRTRGPLLISTPPGPAPIWPLFGGTSLALRFCWISGA